MATPFEVVQSGLNAASPVIISDQQTAQRAIAGVLAIMVVNQAAQSEALIAAIDRLTAATEANK